MDYFSKLTLSTFIVYFLISTPLLAQQRLFGTITDEIGDPIIGGNIKVFIGDAFISGSTADFDGNYKINLEPGVYNVEFSYVGYEQSRIDGVKMNTEEETQLDFQFIAPSQIISGCGGWHQPSLIEIDNPTQGMTISSKELRRVSKPN